MLAQKETHARQPLFLNAFAIGNPLGGQIYLKLVYGGGWGLYRGFKGVSLSFLTGYSYWGEKKTHTR